MRIKAGAILLVAALFVVVAPAAGRAGSAGKAGKRNYTMGMHFISGGGIASSQFLDITNLLLDITSKKGGDNWAGAKYGNYDDLTRDFMNGKIDAGNIFPYQAVVMMDKNSGFYPWSTYTVNNKRKRAFCLWSPKTLPLKSPGDIVGKSYMNDENNPMILVMLRELLFSLGVDRPLWSVFRSFTLVPSQNSAYMALAMGRNDFYWDSDDFDTLIKVINPGLQSKLGHKYCSEPVYARSAILFSRKSFSPAAFSRYASIYEEYLSTYESELQSKPETKSLRTYMKMGKIKFIPASPDEFKTEWALYRKAKKNGWLEEAEYIVDVMKKSGIGKEVEIRPTYKMCRKSCAKEKSKENQYKCMETCSPR